MTIQPTTTKDDLTSTDSLWSAAKLEVKLEKRDYVTPKQDEFYRSVMDAIRDDRDLEYEYGGILDCCFENYPE